MIPDATARAVSAVKRFALRQERGDACDLCAAPLAESHEHLLDPAVRQLVCACASCACLFPAGGPARYRRVLTRVRRIAGMALDDATFRALEIPVRLAFVTPSRVHGKVFATYPNAGGATESVVPDAAWNDLVQAFPALAGLEPDVEGLIIDHLSGRCDCYVATVDVCHRVVGLLRREAGRGSGSGEVARALAALAEAPA